MNRYIHTDKIEPLIQITILTLYCVWHLPTKVLQMMHEMRYQSEFIWRREKNERESERYKRLKTIIYRWQSPLGNHMLCSAFMRFIWWERVFFFRRFSNHPSLFVSFTLQCNVEYTVCVRFFSSFGRIPQCSVQWSQVGCKRELENFSHSINTSIAWNVRARERLYLFAAAAAAANSCDFQYLDAWSWYRSWYVECQNIF